MTSDRHYIDLNKILSEEAQKSLDVFHFKDLSRTKITDFVVDNAYGIELGVAGGSFSRELLDSGKFYKLFGVDMYSDHHNVAEFCHAIQYVGLERNFSILRMSFDEAINIFPDAFFDFIYVDGYAHTGSMGGRIFEKWLPKLKVGGVFGIDDYDDHWPLQKAAVNHFVKAQNVRLNVLSAVRGNGAFDRYPSCFFIKKNDKSYFADPEIVRLSGGFVGSNSGGKRIQISKNDLTSILCHIKDRHPNFAAELKKLL